MQLAQNRAKELEVEKEMLVARQHEANRALDMGQHQIGTELDRMREEFARVKVQKNDLEIETKEAAEREKKWRDTIDRLNRDLVALQTNLARKETDAAETVSLQEKKSSALLGDLRFMRDENTKLHERLKEANESVLMLEQHAAQAAQEQAQVEVARD